MVRSNTVTVNVISVLSITGVGLRAQDPFTGALSTTVTAYAGQTITFYVEVDYNRAPDDIDYAQKRLAVDIYVNGAYQRTLYYDLQRGSTHQTVSFDLTFSEPGTYEIYVDASLAPK